MCNKQWISWSKYVGMWCKEWLVVVVVVICLVSYRSNSSIGSGTGVGVFICLGYLCIRYKQWLQLLFHFFYILLLFINLIFLLSTLYSNVEAGSSSKVLWLTLHYLLQILFLFPAETYGGRTLGSYPYTSSTKQELILPSPPCSLRPPRGHPCF